MKNFCLASLALISVLTLSACNKEHAEDMPSNQKEPADIPAAIVKSRALEAIQNIEKLIAAIDEWKTAHPGALSYSIHFIGSDMISSTGKIYAKRAENAPKIDCTSMQVNSCENAHFVYSAECPATITTCLAFVRSKQKDRFGKDLFSLLAVKDSTSGIWNKTCVTNFENEVDDGIKICTYLKDKGW